MALRVTAQGGKSFIYEARIRGEKYQRALGRWPDMSLGEARTLAYEYNMMVEQGRDPFKEARDVVEASAAEKTFGELVN